MREFAAAALAVEVFMVVFIIFCKVYDLSTAMFFAFALGLLARRKFGAYYLLFPLACMNRETSVLLAVFFMFYYFSRLERRDWITGALYQGFIFIIIRIFLMVIFADNAGAPFLFRPVENVTEHVKHPWQSLFFFAAVMLIVGMCVRNWHEKPMFLRTAFVLLAPALMILYVLFGSAFEVRVFAEIYPLAIVMATWDWFS